MLTACSPSAGKGGSGGPKAATVRVYLALRKNPADWRITGFEGTGVFATLPGLRNNDWTRILGWPGYRVYRSEIDEEAKALRLWVRRKSGGRVCSGCGRSVREIAEVYEREVRDLPCFEYRTTVWSSCTGCAVRIAG